MARSISTSEAKANLNSYMDWAAENHEGVVIQRRGNPKAVLIAYSDYQKFIEWQEEYRRQSALEELQQLAAEIHFQKNEDLSSEESEEIAERFVRETIEQMIADGKVVYDTGSETE